MWSSPWVVMVCFSCNIILHIYVLNFLVCVGNIMACLGAGQYDFEEAILKQTKCKVFTFDWYVLCFCRHAMFACMRL